MSTPDTGAFRLFVVDDSEPVLSSIERMLELEPTFRLAGTATSAEEALVAIQQKHQEIDVVLMDINLPGKDGISATAEIKLRYQLPVVMLSVESDHEYLRKAMQAGARDYLVKPFDTSALVQAIQGLEIERSSAEQPLASDRIAVFSPKGGVGKSTITVNMGFAFSKFVEGTIALLDFDLEFGVLASLLGLTAEQTVVDLCTHKPLNRHMLGEVMTRDYGLPFEVLAAPTMPHLKERVSGGAQADPDRDYIDDILQLVSKEYDKVIVDTTSGFDPVNLAVVDWADRVLVVLTPEIPTIENGAKTLRILIDHLGYSPGKVQVVLNHLNDNSLEVEQIEHALDHAVDFILPYGGKSAHEAVNTGRPITASRKRDPLHNALVSMAARILGEADDGTSKPSRSGSPLGRVTSLFR